jgi:hypothetical protein
MPFLAESAFAHGGETISVSSICSLCSARKKLGDERHARRPKVGEAIACLYAWPPIGLASDPNADARKRTVEAAVFFLRRIDASVHGAKEEIGAIAEADFGACIAE